MSKIIIAEKGNISYYGNIKKISEKIGVHRNTISNWINEKKEIIYKNGFKIKLNTEKL